MFQKIGIGLKVIRKAQNPVCLDIQAVFEMNIVDKFIFHIQFFYFVFKKKFHSLLDMFSYQFMKNSLSVLDF